MSVFVKAVAAKAPRTKESGQIALLYAAILIVFAVAQLFTFDKFIAFFPLLSFPLGVMAASALPPVLVAAEVFAVPFLLRMTLSPAFRWFSMLCGWLVAIFWVCISFWIVTAHPDAATVGFLGTAVNLVPGWWAVLVSLAFGILAAWSTWGLLSTRQTKK